MRYFTLGYEPIPVISGRKRPALDGWQEVKLNLDTIRTWGDARPGELSTGIRTRFTPSFDIDIHDAKMADQVQQALLNLLPQGTILTRVGAAPKRLIPTRCTEPFDKISMHFKSPDNVVHGIDVLCDGQQFVAEGIHETTQQPYHWKDNVNLLNVAHEHLPLVDKALAQRFVAQAGEIMQRAGWTQVDAQGRPREWPMRYSFCLWSLTLRGLKPGGYELRVRTVDRNDMAQPEPRPYQRSGRNAIQVKQLVVMG